VVVPPEVLAAFPAVPTCGLVCRSIEGSYGFFLVSFRGLEGHEGVLESRA